MRRRCMRRRCMRVARAPPCLSTALRSTHGLHERRSRAACGAGAAGTASGAGAAAAAAAAAAARHRVVLAPLEHVDEGEGVEVALRHLVRLMNQVRCVVQEEGLVRRASWPPPRGVLRRRHRAAAHDTAEA